MQISVKWKDVAFVHMPDIKQMHYFVFDISKLFACKIHSGHTTFKVNKKILKKCKIKIKIKHFLFLNTGLYNA